ncbi:MAG: hypothetical protein K8S98_01485 [Planctomycetes bacterium]|nr:hypothetical protein [Planctomycetota bacterium]
MAANVRLRRLLDTALGVVFVAGLCAPLADFALRPSAARSPARERRVPAEPPPASAKLDDVLRFPARAERWWNDWFGLRDVLIGTRNHMTWSVFDTAPAELVVKGRDGWLFYQGTNDALHADRGARPLAPDAVAAWKRVFDARRAWCEARGIQFLVAIVPSKARIYPELLPPAFARLGPGRVDQVRAALGPEWNDAWIDLEPVLRREKELDTPDDPSFAPYGTHWDDRGAFAGYRAIVAAIARAHPELAPLEPSDFVRELDASEGDTWAGRMYLDDILHQRVQRWRLAAPRAVAVPSLEEYVRDAKLSRAAAPLGKAYFLHDSFGPDLRAWLGEHFRETWTRWQYGFEPREIAAFAPDVVVLLFSDRYFVVSEPTLSPDELADSPTGRAERWSSAHDVLLRLSPNEDRARLQLVGRPTVEATGDGLALTTTLASDYVVLPKFDVAGTAPLVVRLVVDSPRATELQLFFKTRASPRFTRGLGLTATLREGVNEVFFELPAADLLGELALRPGVEPDRYVLREFEVRR